MCYELKKPITDTQRADFIVEYNHNQGLRIEDTEMFLFALEPDEIMGEKEIEIDVPDFDEDGNPIMIDVEETITVIDYDDEGNPIGEHEETITKHVQKTHKETITVPYPVKNPDYPAIELEHAKSVKIAENDKARDTALNAGVMYKDVLFDSDTDQKINLLAIVSTMDEEQTIVWFGKDNQPLECDKADLINIGGLITQLHSFCWNKNAEIKSAIGKAKTMKALEKVVIDYDNTDSAE